MCLSACTHSAYCGHSLYDDNIMIIITLMITTIIISITTQDEAAAEGCLQLVNKCRNDVSKGKMGCRYNAVVQINA